MEKRFNKQLASLINIAKEEEELNAMIILLIFSMHRLNGNESDFTKIVQSASQKLQIIKKNDDLNQN